MGFRVTVASETRDVIPAIASYARAGRCALFAGAGLSRAVGYPDWRGLLERLITEACPPDTAATANSELSRLLAAGKLADVADQCREVLGRSDLFSFLRRELSKPDTLPLKETHGSIVKTPYSCIVTTNFDTLLEDAYGIWGARGVPKAPTGVELANHGTLLLDGAFFILKAHGSVTDEASIVFATEDYRRIIHANPAFQSVMSAILMTNAVLFVGYSLSDPNFRLLMESQLTTFGTKSPPRYAVMEDVGEYERALMERTMGLRVLSYPKGEHARVGELLHGIQEATSQQKGQPAESGVSYVHRKRSPTRSLVVSIRARGPRLDVGWSHTHSSVASVSDTPLEQRAFDTIRPLDWPRLSTSLSTAVDSFFQTESAVRDVGNELVGALPSALVDALSTPQLDLVTLDLDAASAALPWEWATIGNRALMHRVATCRTMAEVSDSARGRPFVRTPLRALVIGDTQPIIAETGKRLVLPGAHEEATTIAELLQSAQPGTTVVTLTGRQAHYSRLMRELHDHEFDMVHFAGHAWVEDGSAYMALHDHIVFASELAMLFNRRPPAMLFMNSHHTGFVPAFTQAAPLALPRYASVDDFHRRLRQRQYGFEYVAARAGVGSFVGCIGEPSDTGARDVAVSTYRHLLGGAHLAGALYRARSSAHAEDDVTPYYLLMAGYPDLHLVPPATD
ncbi:MAG: SIR2 family protein [Gemmatimonadaceae bacterium]